MSSTAPELRAFGVEPDEVGKRLDRFVADHVPELGRRHAQSWIERGRVLVNGRRQRKSYVLAPEDRVSVELAHFGAAVPAPHLELVVLLERDDLVVVDKPAGVPSGALVGSETNTLAGALLARYPEMARIGFGQREPGLLHRLDTFTSGALVAARTRTTFDELRVEMVTGRFTKTYLAVVESSAIDDGGHIDLPLLPDESDSRRVRVARPGEHGARASVSSYRTLERGRRFALVLVEVSAAYRHQVRVHLSARGSPLVGDRLYGGLDVGLGDRHLLHAHQVAASGATVAPFDVCAPLPADFSTLLSDDGLSEERVNATITERTSRSS